MSNVPISGLPAAGALNGTFLFPVVDIGTPNVTQQATISQLNALYLPIAGGSIAGSLAIAGQLNVAGVLTLGNIGTAPGELVMIDGSQTYDVVVTTSVFTGNRNIQLTDPGVVTSYIQTNGILPTAAYFPGAMRISLPTCKNADGTTLAASASSGKFGILITPGTSEYLVSEAANSSTVTDEFAFEFVLPPSYKAAANIVLTVNCNYVLGSGTVGTHTLTMAAYLCADAGTQGANIIATAAQAVPSSAGNAVFTLTGTTLMPGQRLFCTGTMVIQDTGGHNVTGQINSIQFA